MIGKIRDAIHTLSCASESKTFLKRLQSMSDRHVAIVLFCALYIRDLYKHADPGFDIFNEYISEEHNGIENTDIYKTLRKNKKIYKNEFALNGLNICLWTLRYHVFDEQYRQDRSQKLSLLIKDNIISMWEVLDRGFGYLDNLSESEMTEFYYIIVNIANPVKRGTLISFSVNERELPAFMKIQNNKFSQSKEMSKNKHRDAHWLGYLFIIIILLSLFYAASD